MVVNGYSWVDVIFCFEGDMWEIGFVVDEFFWVIGLCV